MQVAEEHGGEIIQATRVANRISLRLSCDRTSLSSSFAMWTKTEIQGQLLGKVAKSFDSQFRAKNIFHT